MKTSENMVKLVKTNIKKIGRKLVKKIENRSIQGAPGGLNPLLPRRLADGGRPLKKHTMVRQHTTDIAMQCNTLGLPLGKFLGQAKLSFAKIFIQPQSLAVFFFFQNPHCLYDSPGYTGSVKYT